MLPAEQQEHSLATVQRLFPVATPECRAFQDEPLRQSGTLDAARDETRHRHDAGAYQDRDTVPCGPVLRHDQAGLR